jgi:hypothetical protein
MRMAHSVYAVIQTNLQGDRRRVASFNARSEADQEALRRFLSDDGMRLYEVESEAECKQCGGPNSDEMLEYCPDCREAAAGSFLR